MAHTKPLGTECSLYYDTDDEIQIGDVMQTSAGTCYRVIVARRVSDRSRHYPQRHNLRCVRISADDVETDDYIHPLFWYSRG